MDEITHILSVEKRKSLRLKMMKADDDSYDFFFQFPKLGKLKAGDPIARFAGIQINKHAYIYLYYHIFLTPKS